MNPKLNQITADAILGERKTEHLRTWVEAFDKEFGYQFSNISLFLTNLADILDSSLVSEGEKKPSIWEDREARRRLANPETDTEFAKRMIEEWKDYCKAEYMDDYVTIREADRIIDFFNRPDYWLDKETQ